VIYVRDDAKVPDIGGRDGRQDLVVSRHGARACCPGPPDSRHTEPRQPLRPAKASLRTPRSQRRGHSQPVNAPPSTGDGVLLSVFVFSATEVATFTYVEGLGRGSGKPSSVGSRWVGTWVR
jgi:hypothetical protein